MINDCKVKNGNWSILTCLVKIVSSKYSFYIKKIYVCRIMNDKHIIFKDKPIKKTVKINNKANNGNYVDRFLSCQRRKKLFKIKRKILIVIKHTPISRTIIAYP